MSLRRMPRLEQNVAGSRETATTSSSRVSAQNPGVGCQCTGDSARSRRKSGNGSPARNAGSSSGGENGMGCELSQLAPHVDRALAPQFFALNCDADTFAAV